MADAAQVPQFIRLPLPSHRCAVTGLSRTSLVELVMAKKVRAAKLCKPGSKRGITLINRKSLLDYLSSLSS